jgi:hypothetical protein
MGNTFNAGLSTDRVREAGMTESIIYPGKVLALYEDNEGTLKVLVHSVEYKTATNVEQNKDILKALHYILWQE